MAVAGGLTAAWLGGLAASMLLAAIVAVVSTAGRLAFDSLVQRDAPDANRGRSFAAFELRFQLVWVVGAVIPVLISIPLDGGVPDHRRRGRLRAVLLHGRPAGRPHAPTSTARRTAPASPPDESEPAQSATREVGTAPDPTTVDPTPR